MPFSAALSVWPSLNVLGIVSWVEDKHNLRFQEHASRHTMMSFVQSRIISPAKDRSASPWLLFSWDHLSLVGASSLVSSNPQVTALALHFSHSCCHLEPPTQCQMPDQFSRTEKKNSLMSQPLGTSGITLPTFPPDFQSKHLCAIFKPLRILARLSKTEEKCCLHSLCRCHAVVDGIYHLCMLASPV